MNSKNVKPLIIRSKLIPPKQVICGFTTRNGGVSPPPFDSLNVSFHTSDDPLNIRENHRIVYNYLEVDETHVALMEQVHGKKISIVQTGGIFPETDGLITSKSRMMLAVIVADCIPLLLFDPAHDVIGALHCGWRSITAGIAEEALKIMIEEFGTHQENVIAVMGPSAGSCCYETGEDTAKLFRSASVIKRDGQLYVDLKVELRDHLFMAGLNSRNIEIFTDCTICNEKLYFSHRRDNVNAGRMMGYIMIK